MYNKIINHLHSVMTNAFLFTHIDNEMGFKINDQLTARLQTQKKTQ